MRPAAEILAQCACTRLRTVARLVTRDYDNALRATGLKVSQLAVLAAVDAMDAPSIAALSKALHMDRTTLSRNLQPLVAGRLVVTREEGRRKTAAITARGRGAIQAALPLWRQAQHALLGRLGPALVASTEEQVRQLARAP